MDVPKSLSPEPFEGKSLAIGHFPIARFPQRPLFQSGSVGARGETSVTLIEKLVRDLTNVLHEYPVEGKEGKYHAFGLNSPTMAILDMSGVSLAPPDQR